MMFGRTALGAVRHHYRDLAKPGPVRAVHDPVYRPGGDAGLVEAGREFDTMDGAFAAGDVLDSFGGGRVVIGSPRRRSSARPPERDRADAA